MAKITKRTLRQYLAERSQEELAAEIVALFDRFDAIKDYYHAQLSDDDEEVRAKYKALVEREFTPARGFPQLRLSVARKAIADYQKVSGSLDGRIDLMLAYVEAGVRCTNTYGDLYEQFYNSMESMYKSAVDLIVEHKLQPTYERRCWQIVHDTRNTGWGFHDELSLIYSEAFGG
jgi:hypothetical protein